MPKLQISATFPGELLIVKLLDFATEIVRGQPPEVKKQMWQWYIEDMKRFRKLLKIVER